MIQLLLALFFIIWAGCILGGLFLLFAIPCTALTTSSVALFCLFYVWYKATLFVSSFVHGRPLEYISAQANYTIDVTPRFAQIIRAWKTAERKGFLESAQFYINKSMGFIGEKAISTMRYITKQHRLHVVLIKCSMLVLFWPFVMLVKGAILVRHWFLTMIYWLLHEVNKLISILMGVSNYLMGTQRIAPPVEQMLFHIWTFSVGLPVIFCNSIQHVVMSVLYLPYNGFKWFVSLLIPHQMMTKSSGAIFLTAVENVPLVGQNAVVQEQARRLSTSLSNAVDGMTSFKDDATERYHVIMSRLHSYVDGYISIPRDVVMLYAQDYLVVRPSNAIRKWVQENLQFPDIIQANNALHNIHHNPESHLPQQSKRQCKHAHKHHHKPGCRKYQPKEDGVSSCGRDAQQHAQSQQKLKYQPKEDGVSSCGSDAQQHAQPLQTQQYHKHRQLKRQQKHQLQQLQQQWQQEYQKQSTIPGKSK